MGTRETIIDLLRSTNREGMAGLLTAMEMDGFFTSPCSGAHHLAVEGGLAEHSLNVYRTMKELVESLCVGTEISDESIIICALLHDLGKMGDFQKPNYVPNILKTGQSKAKPFKTNPDLIHEEHEIRSVIIAREHIKLTEEENCAILHHNGTYGKLDSAYTSYYDKHKLSFLLHTADMWCSRFVETDGEEEE